MNRIISGVCFALTAQLSFAQGIDCEPVVRKFEDRQEEIKLCKLKTSEDGSVLSNWRSIQYYNPQRLPQSGIEFDQMDVYEMYHCTLGTVSVGPVVGRLNGKVVSKNLALEFSDPVVVLPNSNSEWLLRNQCIFAKAIVESRK